MKPTLYFAYGSNMSHRRLRSRVPSAQPLGRGELDNHAHAFHKIGTDGSGKCDIVPAANATVHGVLFAMAAAELKVLDEFEGMGKEYQRLVVQVRDTSGQHVEAWTYVGIGIDPGLRPFSWYKRHVLEGAREAQLPEAYVRLIEAVEAIEDPDPERAARELAIYIARSA